MVMIIESGALYAAALISIIAAYAAGSNSQYIIVDFVRSDISLLRVFLLNYVAFKFTPQLTSLIVSLVYSSDISVLIELCT